MHILDTSLASIKKQGQEFLALVRLLKAETDMVEDPAVTDAMDIEYASSAAKAVLHQDPHGARQILYLTAAFFLVSLIWMALASVEEQTHGTGKVIPSGHLQIIQNLEGGIVAELYVREGEIVTRDQPLLRIDDTQFASSYREQDKDGQYLKIKVARLQAEVDGVAFTPLKDFPDIDPALAAREISLYQSRHQELDGQFRILDEQISQKEHEINENKAKVEQLSRGLSLAIQELNMTQPLVAQGAISQVEVLRLQRDINDRKGQLEITRLEVTKLDSSLQEARNKRDSHRLEFVAKARQELNESQVELSRIDEKRGALQDMVTRTVVRSPVAGQINRLLVNTIGGVVQPGKDLVEIVPTEDNLLVEARIAPADIAYLRPGQKAVIKITAYDFTIYGGLEGELIHISPDSLVDDKGNSYFLVRVKTDQGFLGRAGQPLPIIPGMTVEVEIITGQKTVLSYVLKPILRAQSRAFSER